MSQSGYRDAHARRRGLPFVMWTGFRREKAVQMAAKLNAGAELVPGAHPDRSYEVERGCGVWRVVKYVERER